jgi:hypothetical protein
MRVQTTLGLGAALGLFLTQAASALPSAPQLPSAHHGVQLAALFGESDEEKAARKQHEDNQDATIQMLNQRVRDLEDSLRQTTGGFRVPALRDGGAATGRDARTAR